MKHEKVKGTHPAITMYREGTDRNAGAENFYPQNSHTYAMVNGELYPMCGYGWNRTDGHGFSILRNYPGTEGTCKLCRKNLRRGDLPYMKGFPHKTRWI